MSRGPIIVLLCATATACSMNQERYEQRVDEAICKWKAECFDWEGTQSTCLADAEASRTGSSCEYAPDQARQCARDLERLECPDGGELVWPDACGGVWDC